MASILLVEDNTGALEGMWRYMCTLGHQGCKAQCLREALSLLDMGSWDVVLVDQCLGEGQRGADLLARARKSHPHAHLILMSGLECPKFNDGEPPWHRFLKKPFSMAELQELLKGVDDAKHNSNRTTRPQHHCTPPRGDRNATDRL
jgi:DNA-binding NtrC family response regulator